MNSFPIPADEPPTPAQASARLAEQDAAIQSVMSALAGAVGTQIGGQATAVGKIGAKIQGAAANQTAAQSTGINNVLSALHVAAQAALQEQQRQMNVVAGNVVSPTTLPAYQPPETPTTVAPRIVMPDGTIERLGNGQLVMRVNGQWIDIDEAQPGLAPTPPAVPIFTIGGFNPFLQPVPPAQPVPPPSPTRLPPTLTPAPSDGRSPFPPVIVSSAPPTASTGLPPTSMPSAPPTEPSSNAPTPTTPGSGTSGPPTSAGMSGQGLPSQIPQDLQSPPVPVPPTGPTPPTPPTPTSPVPSPPPSVIVAPAPCPPPNIYINIPPCPPCPPVQAQTAPPPRPIDVEAAGAEKPDVGHTLHAMLGPCADLAPLAKLWLVPGSDDWCKAMPVLRDMLTALGAKIVSWACKAIDGAWSGLNEIWTVLNNAVGAIPDALSPVRTLFIALRDVVFQGMKFLLQTARTCKCIQQIASLKGACQPGTLIGLAAVRTLIAMLKSLDVGVNVPVSLKVTITVAFPQIDRVLDYVTEYSCPTLIPGIGDAITSFSQGQINPATFTCWMLCAGADPGVWGPVVIARAQHLDAKQVIELGRRAGLADAAIAVQLAQRGWLRAPDRTGEQILFDKLPNLAEIEHWSSKGALNAGYVAKWGLDVGFAELWTGDYGTALRAQGVTQDVAQHQWRAHWRTPSDQQAREFLYRLRPGRPGVTIPFTDADYRQLVLSHDASPHLKDLLYETRYREVSPQLSGQMAARNLSPDSAIVDGFLDQGYAPADAARLAHLEKVRTLQALDASVTGYTPKTLASMVRLGVMHPDQAYIWFTRWGYTRTESDEAVAGSIHAYESKLRTQYNRLAQRKVMTNALKAYQVGTISAVQTETALMALGVQKATATVLVKATDAAFLSQLAGQVISHTKSAFLKGEITREQAHAALVTAGIVEPRAHQYVAAWAAELKTPSKVLTASEVLKMFSDGLITRSAAETRLRNLGYKNPDAQLKLRDAALKILARRVKAEQSIVKGTKEGSAILASLAADAAAQAKELMASAEREAPIKSVRKWYEAGALTAEYATELLVSYGYTPSAAGRLITTWTVGGITTAEAQTQGAATGSRVGTGGAK